MFQCARFSLSLFRFNSLISGSNSMLTQVDTIKEFALKSMLESTCKHHIALSAIDVHICLLLPYRLIKNLI